MNKKAMIGVIGAGRTGRILIDRLKKSWRLAVIDRNPRKLKIVSSEEESEDSMSLFEGDAASYLTLKNAGLGFAYHVIITVNDDQTSKEIIRHLKSRFNIKNIFARINDQSLAEKLRRDGISVVTPYETMANMIVNQLNFGETIAINIGKGVGEILQIELTRSSPLVGKRLRDLPPKQWIIGAIYRPKRKLGLKTALSYFRNFEISGEDEIIIPTGDTVPKSGDKVILIGDPHLLRSTAQYLKAGASVFPRRHGDKVLSLIVDPVSPLHLYKEFTWLLSRMEPTTIDYLYCDDSHIETLKKMDYPENWPDKIKERSHYYQTKTFRLGSDLAKIFKNSRLGLIIYKQPDRLFQIIKHRLFVQKRLFQEAKKKNSPIWMLKGHKNEIKGITIFVSDMEETLLGAELALDAAKKFSLPVQALQVIPPKEITGNEQLNALKNTMQSVREIAVLYGVPMKENTLTGNPLKETLNHIMPHELLVMVMPLKRRKNLLLPPTVEKILVKKFPGSVMLVVV